MTRTVDEPLNEDLDVAKLRKDVESGNYSLDDPLVIQNLRKIYDDGHVALHDLCLIAKSNTCLGMLGFIL